MIKISKDHTNRRGYNWLVYDISDRFLFRHRDLYCGKLYDLGAGESPYESFFLQYADSYCSVDWQGSFHNTNADITADLNTILPIEDSSADTIVCLSVLEHLKEPQLFLNEAYRILKPGGFIVLQVPWQWRVHESPFDFFRYTPYGLKYIFEKAGYSDVLVEPQSGFFSTMIMKSNYFSLRLIRGPRLVKKMIRGFLSIFWYAGQKLAPMMDKLDKDWLQESSGYFVTARKR